MSLNPLDLMSRMQFQFRGGQFSKPKLLVSVIVMDENNILLPCCKEKKYYLVSFIENGCK
jgi:hypothetical protein